MNLDLLWVCDLFSLSISIFSIFLGEEYTLAMAVEYWLGICGKRGNIVKNLSSSNANDEIAKKYGCKCFKAAVGESNVRFLTLFIYIH